MTAPARDTEEASLQTFPMEEFLDRLMAAESGGRLRSRNPRSTAVGPFQFIESTFLFVVKKHFPSEVAGLSERKVLALRTDMVFSRRAARAYAGDLIAALKDEGLPATTVNVRIAFLVGPFAAVRLLRAPSDQSLKTVLSAEAIQANPYMSRATVANLIRKAAADVGATAVPEPPGQPAPTETALEGTPAATAVASQREPAGTSAASQDEPAVTLVALSDEPPASAAALQGKPAGAPAAPKGEPTATNLSFEIKCKIGLASCRRWIALQQRKAQLQVRSAQR